jgi:uncharacterized protein (DUF779 family)
MCDPDGDFLVSTTSASAIWTVGPTELGPVLDVESQFAYWKHTHLTIDVVPGRGAGFSVEAPEGVRFSSLAPAHRRRVRSLPASDRPVSKLRDLRPQLWLQAFVA